MNFVYEHILNKLSLAFDFFLFYVLKLSNQMMDETKSKPNISITRVDRPVDKCKNDGNLSNIKKTDKIKDTK